MESKHTFESAVVEHLANENIILINFKKPSKSDDFRNIWNTALELSEHTKSQKWLLNQVEQVVHPDDQTWVETVWFPKSMEVRPISAEDPRYVSIVQSKNFFAEFSAKNFIKNNSAPGFLVNVLKTEEEALAWLVEQ